MNPLGVAAVFRQQERVVRNRKFKVRGVDVLIVVVENVKRPLRPVFEKFLDADPPERFKVLAFVNDHSIKPAVGGRNGVEECFG